MDCCLEKFPMEYELEPLISYYVSFYDHKDTDPLSQTAHCFSYTYELNEQK